MDWVQIELILDSEYLTNNKDEWKYGIHYDVICHYSLLRLVAKQGEMFHPNEKDAYGLNPVCLFQQEDDGMWEIAEVDRES